MSFQRLRGPIVARVRARIDGLVSDPRPAAAVKLAGRDDFRIRVGDYRIVYAVDDSRQLIIVARIAHRRDPADRGPRVRV